MEDKNKDVEITKIEIVNNDSNSNEDKSKELTKEDVIQKMDEIADMIEEETEAQKEVSYFKHMFFVYNASKVQSIISFAIALGLFFLRSFIGTSSMMFARFLVMYVGMLVINADISLFRCALNKEVTENIKKISLKLALLLLGAIISSFVLIILV